MWGKSEMTLSRVDEARNNKVENYARPVSL